MSKLFYVIKKLLKPKPKLPLTPAEKRAIDEQVVIIDPITRGK